MRVIPSQLGVVRGAVQLCVSILEKTVALISRSLVNAGAQEKCHLSTTRKIRSRFFSRNVFL
jgi:hypothetical protein